MEGFCFEIVKNCSGKLVSLNIPSSRRIDYKLLLKSIALTGCIHIRLLAELPDEGIDDILLYSLFNCPENPEITRLEFSSLAFSALDGSRSWPYSITTTSFVSV